MSTRRHLHWETTLDRLELEVILAERLLAEPTHHEPDHEPWDEPRLGGPIPPDLADRAVAIRARQLQLEGALAAALGATRRQHRFADRVDRATGRRLDQSVYVDVDA